MAYALLVERITAQVLADRQAAAVLMAAGAKGVEMPEVEAALAAFDAMLAEEPRQASRDELVLREALGLGRAS